MSHLLDAVGLLHRRQLSAATRVEDVVVRAVAGVASARKRVPALSGGLTQPLREIARPVRRVVGSPSGLAIFVGSATRDWVELQLQFEMAISRAWAGETPAATAVEMRPRALHLAADA
jgi:hypothetical protein